MKKLKILKLSPDSRYLQKLALNLPSLVLLALMTACSSSFPPALFLAGQYTTRKVLQRFSNCHVTGLPSVCTVTPPSDTCTPTKALQRRSPDLNEHSSLFRRGDIRGSCRLTASVRRKFSAFFVFGDGFSSAHDVLRVLKVADILFLFCCFSFNTSCTSCNLPLLRSSASLL